MQTRCQTLARLGLLNLLQERAWMGRWRGLVQAVGLEMSSFRNKNICKHSKYFVYLFRSYDAIVIWWSVIIIVKWGDC